MHFLFFSGGKEHAWASVLFVMVMVLGALSINFLKGGRCVQTIVF